MKTLRLLALAALALSPAAMPAPAAADENFTVTCASSQLENGKTSCEGYALYTFLSSGPDAKIAIDLTAPPTHCSKLSYIVKSGAGTRTFGVTGRMDPGQMRRIGLGKGHPSGLLTVRIDAFGVVGGCNTGVMQNWGVNANAVLY